MTAIICTAIISISVIIITSLLCFKGIIFYKKMEVIPTKILTSVPRSKEMDDIEKLLNTVDIVNAQHAAENQHVPHNEQPGYASGTTAMDAALQKIHEVFGPELPPEDNKGDNT